VTVCLIVWIFPARAVGIAIGYFPPGVPALITGLTVMTTSIPIAIWLIQMIKCLMQKSGTKNSGTSSRI
jgi:ACR3 family arsenite efflux pump ArsB